MSLKSTKPILVTLKAQVLIHFLLHLQNDPILQVCVCWWGGKLPSCAFFHLTMSPSVSRCLAKSLLACPHLLWQTVPQLFISCCVGQKTVEEMKNNYPWIICVKHLPLFLLATELFDGWVWYLKQHWKAVFLNKLPCHTLTHCHHKACIVLFKIKFFWYVLPTNQCTLEFHNYFHQMPNFVWGGMVWNIPYILESNPHPFYSFRGLKNQMRIRFAV
jgi:hypothetical protein